MYKYFALECILPLTSMSPSTRSGPLLLTPRHPPIVDRGGWVLQPPSPRGYTAAECELHMQIPAYDQSRWRMQTENQRIRQTENAKGRATERSREFSWGQDFQDAMDAFLDLYCPLAFSASDLATTLGILIILPPSFQPRPFIMMYPYY